MEDIRTGAINEGGALGEPQGVKPLPNSQRLSVSLAKLEDIFTPEQVAQMIDVLVMTFDNAVTRKCDQSFTILFNDKGYPIGFNGSNNIKPVRPVSTYKAE